jgi:quercetin dioxygenase-like cupin family protein
MPSPALSVRVSAEASPSRIRCAREVIHDGEASSELASPDRFSGRAWRTDYISPADDRGLAGLRFVYEPGARSFWHIHECEQAIIAVYGCGVVAWEGLELPITLNSGDWWHVQPGVAHWHGATPHTAFAHLAVTAGGATTWLHEVSDEEYAVIARQ